ncbi:molybdenum cofactor biosynthesis protein MoaE [Maridesulfovibrio ferrireducens]|uniref:molybdenum cofactor biosynthesis protein MoaE n=1 Tax=Maridesulfovibrio ferrireducens TaxID=246191 RepID=UPI001A31CF5D|nr:molybdenum cofactor biosynthesis protein MoaE [Maridesulfovibrio ferrireducens]MBI9111509.1 molybdenum cofactor biosynthesis protein MoaE [Maridesulfovibrio ferrireducens]
MDISKKISELKQDPEFAKNVGMILVHNGIVRGWSRGSREEVSGIEIKADHEKIEQLRAEYEKSPGIYKIVVEAHEGTFKPGDDVLFIIVAGDIRENVKACLATMLDRVKSEAFTKKEIMA